MLSLKIVVLIPIFCGKSYIFLYFCPEIHIGIDRINVESGKTTCRSVEPFVFQSETSELKTASRHNKNTFLIHI